MIFLFKRFLRYIIMAATKHFGYWVFGSDMNKVNLTTLKKNGVTDLFLNYYAFEAHGETKVKTWIKKAKAQNINVHIWVQCFYNGKWINPATASLTSKLNEIKKYTKIDGVYGIHLDYLRYPGNAYKTTNGATAITNFVKKVRSQNPKIFLSCAVMPEKETKKYYGQDITALAKTVDCIVPMQYKGNYKSNTTWLKEITKFFVDSKATIWSGLQGYKSDNDTTLLSSSELLTDAKACLSAGAKGVVLFRYGMSATINLSSYTSAQKKTTISSADIKTLASKTKEYIEKNKKIPSKITVNNKSYTYGQVAYILSFAVNNYKKAATVFAVKGAEKAAGDVVNEKIKAVDYKNMATRIATYIAKNKQCPNYATNDASKKRVRARVFIYMLARIVNYLYTNGKLPSTAKVDSSYFTTTKTTTQTTTTTKTTTTSRLNDYLTTQGCSGMGQCTGYYCGCNSLQQCFYRLTGIKVAESTIAAVAGTTTNGTDHAGLETAVAWFNKIYNKNIKITWKNFSDLGSSASERWETLKKYMKNGAVFIHLLYRNQWGHYEVILEINGDNLRILNSLGDYCSYPAYCGYIENRTKSTELSYINGISQKSIAILTIG